MNVLSIYRHMFAVPDLRRKILFTLLLFKPFIARPASGPRPVTVEPAREQVLFAFVEEVAEAHPDQILLTGFMRRCDPSYLEAKQKVDRGDIGTPII